MYGTLCEETINGKNDFFTYSDSEISVVYLSLLWVPLHRLSAFEFSFSFAHTFFRTQFYHCSRRYLLWNMMVIKEKWFSIDGRGEESPLIQAAYFQLVQWCGINTNRFSTASCLGRSKLSTSWTQAISTVLLSLPAISSLLCFHLDWMWEVLWWHNEGLSWLSTCWFHQLWGT